MLTLYDGSPMKLITNLYPDYNWLQWKFAHLPSNLYKELKEDRNKQLEFLNFLKDQENLIINEDLLNIPMRQLKKYISLNR